MVAAASACLALAILQCYTLLMISGKLATGDENANANFRRLAVRETCNSRSEVEGELSTLMMLSKLGQRRGRLGASLFS